MSSQAYLNIVKDFVRKTTSIDTETLTDEDLEVVEFEHEGNLVRFYEHPDQTALVVEAEVFPLNAIPPDEQAAVFLMLHKLNFLARLTTQHMVTVTHDDVLITSKLFALEGMNGIALSEAVTAMLETTEELKQQWKNLQHPTDSGFLQDSVKESQGFFLKV